MWGWGVCDTEFCDELSDVRLGHTLDEFLEYISEFSSNCYFHNLRFDGHFIIDYLLRNEYEYVHDSREMKMGQFSALISDTGKFYSITVFWTNGYRTEFKDSLKKFPMQVRKLAKAFKLEVSKGDIDYDADRPIGYKMTAEEADYIARDVLIVAQSLKLALADGMKKLTVGADALAEYKSLVQMKNFIKLFPVLTEDMDREIRKAYRGGFTYKDKRRKGLQGGGKVYDVNSLYPYIMHERPLPYGIPEYESGRVQATEDFPLVIQAITFTAKIRRKHIPCLQIKGTSQFVATEYLEKVEEPTTIYVTNVDIALLNDHYHMNILSYEGGWKFRAASGMFDSYIDKWMDVKKASEGGRREIAKLHLTSLYGKFGTNTNVTGKYPVLDEHDKVVYRRGPEASRDPIYTPIAVFVTSWARDLTIREAQANYDTFAYADTDSLHLLRDTDPEGLNIDPKELGAWKHEYDFTRAYYIRAKAYLEETGECQDRDHEDESQHTPTCHFVNRIAGLPEGVSKTLSFADVKQGAVFHGKLVPRSVPGGVVLTPTPYRLDI